MIETITYYYRGGVERGTGEPGYKWHDGYSENSPNGGILYPWLTKRECQQDAKSRGCIAVFQKTKPQITCKS